jgi:predicted 3-demethylubiquinone-9 3-methyltransferase (glyoxalase superfamily)
VETLDPFLMFCGPHHGQAEEAINHYCAAFPGGRMVSIERYGPGEGEREGTVRVAVFELGGRILRAIDSGAPHAFTFTPAISLWVECSSVAEFEHAAERLVGGGQYLMPPGNYGFSPKVCWIADRYGVTWQLNLAG